MTDTSFEFGQLFSLSRDAVVCTRNDTIIYMNPSAIALFNGDYSGMSAHQIIPGQFLTGDLDQFIASVEIREKNMTFSCTTHEDIRLYSIVLPEEKMERSVIQSISEPIRAITNTIKVPPDSILDHSDQYQDEKLSQYSAILKHSSSKLKRIILNYSIYAACQEGTAKFSPTLVCVNEICQELVNAVADLVEEHGITVDFSADQSVFSCLDVMLVQQMLLNLLCNSLQHTPEGGFIHMKLKATEEFVTILISDTGSGLSRNATLNPFHHFINPVDPESGHISPGLGLGVAESIARLHGGSIILNSTPNEGTTVAVQLRHKTDQLLKSPQRDYRVALSDSVLTGLSPWLTWKDFGSFSD